MGRQTTTGSVQWVGDPKRPSPSDHWRAFITFPRGPTRPARERYWFRLAHGLTEAQARAQALKLGELARAGRLEPPSKLPRADVARVDLDGEIPDHTPTGAETFKGWSLRWLEARKVRGYKSLSADRARLRHWIWPRIGTKAVTRVTRVDVEDWVEWIDEQVREEELGWKTALNAWGVLSKICSDMHSGKPRELRVREDDIALRVAPPDRGTRRAKQFLYPSEFLSLLACDEISLDVRQCYAVAVYLYPRAGELEALNCADIDLVHESVHIHRAVHAESGEIRETKGNRPRRVPIHPHLVPLLKHLVAKAGGLGLLWPEFPPWKDRAGQLRKYLERAGVRRAELFEGGATEKPMTFHDLRATGITWEAIAGTDEVKIQRRAGHSSSTTTQIYIRLADGVRGVNFGAPFPELPEGLWLLDGYRDQKSPSENIVSEDVSMRFGVRDSNPSNTLRSVTKRGETRDFATPLPSPDPPEGTSRGPPDGRVTNPVTTETALESAMQAALAEGDLALTERLLKILDKHITKASRLRIAGRRG